MAESKTSETVLTTFTCRRFLEDDQSVFEVVWKSSISARYSIFFRLEGQKCDLESNLCLTGSQCSLARTGVMWSLLPCPRNHPCECIKDSLQTSRDSRRMFHGERSYSSQDGNRPWKSWYINQLHRHFWPCGDPVFRWPHCMVASMTSVGRGNGLHGISGRGMGSMRSVGGGNGFHEWGGIWAPWDRWGEHGLHEISGEDLFPCTSAKMLFAGIASK